MMRGNKQTFFPSGDPHFVYVYIKLPVGTNVKYTDSITSILEKRVEKVLEKEKPGAPGSIVESIITNVAVSANNPRDNNRSVQSNLGRIQVSFVDFDKRHGKRTGLYKDAIREAVQGIPGVSVEVAQEDGVAALGDGRHGQGLGAELDALPTDPGEHHLPLHRSSPSRRSRPRSCSRWRPIPQACATLVRRSRRPVARSRRLTC